MAANRRIASRDIAAEEVRSESVLDAQRRAVYRAEDSTKWWQQGEYLSFGEIGVLVERISAWAQIDIPFVSDGAGVRVARGNRDSLVLPPFARNTSYVCHEICHTIAKQRDIDDYHGPIFTRMMLDATREFMGETQSDELGQKFVERDVEVSPSDWRTVVPFGAADS
jgi:hypothetical protein